MNELEMENEGNGVKFFFLFLFSVFNVVGLTILLKIIIND